MTPVPDAEPEHPVPPGRSQATRMVPLDPLIPGCGWRIAEPYHLPIEAGIRAERERLRGKRWMVVLFERTLDYDGIYEEVWLDEGFEALPQALQRAEALLDEHASAAKALHPEWPLGVERVRWPMLTHVAGQPVHRLEDFFIHDGVGWGNHHIQVSVMALPDEPIDLELIDAIGANTEFQAHFRKVGRG